MNLGLLSVSLKSFHISSGKAIPVAVILGPWLSSDLLSLAELRVKTFIHVSRLHANPAEKL